ncbi:hypothetical protein BJ875DRAFT_537640 [Amylocarpus encephaloides]|uniref:SET domain-containing protein n=1 Tax=Amylocarpus encephaloides TaxID=45428 RepID=A0A9P8C1W9_9HELO|nr:hypothetical protein BJ875DRAFT_537640 [Amylocarpus encephaloides]
MDTRSRTTFFKRGGTVTELEELGAEHDNATSKLYILTSLPGKGQGLIAVQDISKASRIIFEKSLFRIQSFGSELPVIEKEIERKLNLLSQDDQRAFHSLHNSTPGDSYPLAGIVETNALSLGPGSSVGGIFPIISRINHSCGPNTQHTWNSSITHETIHAIRDIKKGEEIAILYNLGGSSQPRMQRSKRNEALEISDARQLRMQFLDNAIGDSDTVMESPGIALTCFYYDPFKICITHGDEARASVFAQKAYETRLYMEGEDSPDTQKMKSFMANPANHMAFGFSESCVQSKEEVPKNVDAQEFDRWLWLYANSTDGNSDTSSIFDSLDSVSIWRKPRSSFV